MDWGVTDDDRIESLSAATFDGAIRIIKESFCQDEIVCFGTEINKNEVAAEELMELWAVVALDGVSLIAVHIETGEVASVAFNKIQIFYAYRRRRISDGIVQNMLDLPILGSNALVFELNCNFETMQQFSPILATPSHHRNLKIGKILGKTSVQLANKLKDGPVGKMDCERS